MKLKTIKTNEEFRTVYNKAQSIAGAFVVLYRLKRADDNIRFGITVSKKVGKAVQRNRARRLIKESIRLNIKKFTPGYDYVFVARGRAKDAKRIDIDKNIFYLLAKFRKNVKK